MSSAAFLLAFTFRSLSLLLPQTFFQPDEYWQSLEPAHYLAYGYGYLTWEWRDLPGQRNGSLWRDAIVSGRLRSWLWPSCFAGLYKVLAVLKLDDTSFMIVAPRIIGVLIAALTDWHTCRLSAKLLGPGASAGALFLSLTSLFNAHLLPRLLSTSPETLLTVMALCYFPFPPLHLPDTVLISDSGIRMSEDMKVSGDMPTRSGGRSLDDREVVKINLLKNVNYATLDRMPPHQWAAKIPGDNFALAVALATLAICIRPTTLVFWVYMGAELVLRSASTQGVGAVCGLLLTSLITGSSVLAVSTLVDYTITGRMVFPLVSFINENILHGVAGFYGVTNGLYHLTQSLPIILFPIWWWFGRGFVASLLPSKWLSVSLACLDCPDGLRCLARSLVFTISMLSLSPHSEWRFLHPFLPPLVLFALPPLFQDYIPNILGCYRFSRSIRQYTRISKFPFYLCIFAPLVPYFYLNAFHGRAQVGVINVLREGKVGNVTSLLVLAPCHCTPWMSHLHANIPASFLTCEPPIVRAINEPTLQEAFYSTPVKVLEDILRSTVPPPSHIVLFGSLLTLNNGSIMVRQALEDTQYRQVWQGWNGFDFVQDEAERRGHVQIWARDAYLLD